MGTTLSAAIYYRETILDAVDTAPGWRLRTAFEETNAETSFVIVATAMTGIVGIPIYLSLIDFASELTGGAFVALVVSAIVGYAMIDTIMKVVHTVDFWIVCVVLGVLAVLGGGLTMVI